jgi:hypothetical protein
MYLPHSCLGLSITDEQRVTGFEISNVKELDGIKENGLKIRCMMRIIWLMSALASSI